MEVDNTEEESPAEPLDAMQYESAVKPYQPYMDIVKEQSPVSFEAPSPTMKKVKKVRKVKKKIKVQTKPQDGFQIEMNRVEISKGEISPVVVDMEISPKENNKDLRLKPGILKMQLQPIDEESPGMEESLLQERRLGTSPLL